MFGFAVLIGIYSYVIFLLGIVGLLYKHYIVMVTLLVAVFVVVAHRKMLTNKRLILGELRKEPLVLVLISIFVLQAVVNLIGAMGPELGFDALWYHLTLPKLYLQSHKIDALPGGLLYYFAMPKLTEMLYVTSLALQGEILAKIVHFGFGILTAFGLYQLSRMVLSRTFSIIAVLVFYSNLVVGWESIAAYVDLTRTFFETLALLWLVVWSKNMLWKWLMASAIMLGLAITTKLLAIGSLVLFSVLIAYVFVTKKKTLSNLLNALLLYWFMSLLIPSPWFVFSFFHTGNPIYPFFTTVYQVGIDSSAFSGRFIFDLWELFTQAADPISPLYILFLPLYLVYLRIKKVPGEIKLMSFYALIALVIWVVTPRTGGGRFILPYLPAFSLLVAWTIAKLPIKNFLYKASIVIVVLVVISSIAYRARANAKFVPIITGNEPKAQFLSHELNFTFGDFYDIDGYFAKQIQVNDRVLLMGFHNLYYVDFPFVDSSWIQKGEKFNYIAIQNATLPKQFVSSPLIYENKTTRVRLYKTGWMIWD